MRKIYWVVLQSLSYEKEKNKLKNWKERVISKSKVEKIYWVVLQSCF